jgi:hypothetical protein
VKEFFSGKPYEDEIFHQEMTKKDMDEIQRKAFARARYLKKGL